MADTLELDEVNGRFYLVWNVDGDFGATVGEGGSSLALVLELLEYARKSLDQSNVEYFMVESVVAGGVTLSEERNVAQRDERGYFWESLTAATKALRSARAVLKFERLRYKNAEADAPWPEWALQAKAAGWTAPKNWKPSP